MSETPAREPRLPGRPEPAEIGGHEPMLPGAFGSIPPYLSRYLAGECEAVWSELVALGPAVREEPVYSDACAVARETMQRARFNVELIFRRLIRMGYEFADRRQAFIPPPEGSADRLESIERRAGPLPLSLKAWCEIVGEVSFRPKPEWDDDGDFARSGPGSRNWHALRDGDPLDVCSHIGGNDEDAVADRRAWLITGDRAAKEGFGGGGYHIDLPEPAADCLWQPEPITFVEYLRLSFRSGGFPAYGEYPGPGDVPVVAHLRDGLLEI